MCVGLVGAEGGVITVLDGWIKEIENMINIITPLKFYQIYERTLA